MRDERTRFIVRLLDGESMSGLCEEFGISRKTGYKIWNRYQNTGGHALEDRSRKPHRFANQLPEPLERGLVRLKREKPHWGAPQIRELLIRRFPDLRPPAISTVHPVLDRYGLVNCRKRRRHKAQGTRLSRSRQPNDLWCADFKGEFMLGDKRYCYPLTLSDHASRYLLAIEALEGVKEEWAFAVFERAFEEFGLPTGIRTDNGVPFASANGLFGLSRLAVWWLRLGIAIERIQLGHPEQNGRHERLHLTLKKATVVPAASNLLQQQERFNEFQAEYNVDFLPWQLSANEYALILMAITTFYVVKGGMFSVVVTEVIQFCILATSSIVLGIIAIRRVSPEMLQRVVPAGWDNPFFGWRLDLDWSALIPSVTTKIGEDSYSLFGLFFMMLLFKGFLVSAAGPAPNYDMQRILSTRSPKEASLMNMWVNCVLIFPRYFMITGLTILALVFYSETIRSMGSNIDFEMILPYALDRFVPAGLLGLLVAGLLAAFMSNFAATVNAAPPYIINDIYKRFINPHASQKTYVRLSYVASLAVVIAGISVGWFVESIDSVIKWIVSALWGSYTASNVLKWYWWRFNGFGYFWGMVTGIASSLVLAALQLPALNWFPAILLLSLVGCVLGTLLTPAEDEEVLKSFYRRVRPWGFWRPILEKVRQEDPTFQPNRDFGRDMFNIVVGICWQTCLVAVPVFIVIRRFNAVLIALGTVAVTSLILKFTWYDNLDRREAFGQKTGATTESGTMAPMRQ